MCLSRSLTRFTTSNIDGAEDDYVIFTRTCLNRLLPPDIKSVLKRLDPDELDDFEEEEFNILEEVTDSINSLYSLLPYIEDWRNTYQQEVRIPEARQIWLKVPTMAGNDKHRGDHNSFVTGFFLDIEREKFRSTFSGDDLYKCLQFPILPDIEYLEEGRTYNALCRLCQQPVDFSTATDVEAEWREHVLRDLRPFVCLESSCSSPVDPRRFPSLEDWAAHDACYHPRTVVSHYKCPKPCGELFYSVNEFEDHLLSGHLQGKTDLTAAELENLINRCIERRPGEDDASKTKILDAVRVHRGERMVKGALAVLPQHVMKPRPKSSLVEQLRRRAEKIGTRSGNSKASFTSHE